MTWGVATVVAVRDETALARTLVLSVPGWPGHLAGQHVDLRLTAPDGYTATRSYSIASAPAEALVEVTVAAVPDGEVSGYLTGVAAPGDPLEVRGPLGGWFVWRPQQTEPVQLVGGGIGVVPLRAVLRAHTDADSLAPLRLLYSVREPAAVLYPDELAPTTDDRTTGARITVAYTRSAPGGHPRPAGRVDAALLAATTIPSSARPTCYVCGPTGFVEAVAGMLIAAGHDPARVRTERFGPTGGPA